MARNFEHVKEGDSSGHVSSAIDYEDWDGKLKRGWVEVSKPNEWRIKDHDSDSSSGSSRDYIEYRAWDNRLWTAAIDPDLMRFYHEQKGAPIGSGHWDTWIGYKNNGAHWKARFIQKP